MSKSSTELRDLHHNIMDLLDQLTFNVLRWNYGANSAETKGEHFKCAEQIEELLQSEKKQLIERISKEVIGENKILTTAYIQDNPIQAQWEHGQNLLRTEQRKALTEIKKEL